MITLIFLCSFEIRFDVKFNAALLAPYASACMSGCSAIEPRQDEMGAQTPPPALEDFSSRPAVAWKRCKGPAALTVKSCMKVSEVVVSTGVGSEKTPVDQLLALRAKQCLLSGSGSTRSPRAGGEVHTYRHSRSEHPDAPPPSRSLEPPGYYPLSCPRAT